MSSNPFKIQLPDAETKVKNSQSVGQTTNTQETREAKETERLKKTDVYSYAGGGSMATTDGRFENYDGFTRTTSEKTEDKSDEQKTKELFYFVAFCIIFNNFGFILQTFNHITHGFLRQHSFQFSFNLF